MPMMNKVTVRIFGKDYPLRSEDSREYIQRLALYVDDKMRETMDKNDKLSNSMIAVLTALNIADEYHKMKSDYEEMKKRFDDPEYELKVTRDELQKVTSEFDQRNKAYERMISEFTHLIETSTAYESDISKLKRKMDFLNEELEKKERELSDSNHFVQRLEVELGTTREELEAIVEEEEDESTQ